MNLNTILQALLFLQVFILGGLSTYAILYHRKHKSVVGNSEALHASELNDSLSPVLKQRLVEETELRYQNVLNQTTSKLNQDLQLSGEQINQLVKKLANDIVAGEMEHYRLELGRLHDQANHEMSDIRGEIEKNKSEIKAKMAAEVEAEKQKLLKHIDTKLADAVGSFLSETLQHNVDLGNQTAYLISMLEEHKADFINEVGTNEAEPAK